MAKQKSIRNEGDYVELKWNNSYYKFELRSNGKMEISQWLGYDIIRSEEQTKEDARKYYKILLSVGYVVNHIACHPD